LGRFLAKKWEQEEGGKVNGGRLREGKDILMASGRVKMMPRHGNVRVGEWEEWSRE